MALQNAFGDIALDTSVQQVKTAVEAITTTIDNGISVTGSTVALDAPTLAALETINANTGALTDTELRASPLPLPTGAATDATLTAIQSLQTEIKNLNDTILYMMSAILEKMPRVTGNDQAAVSIESGSVGISSGTVTTVTTVGTVTNQSQIGGQDALTIARSQIMAGTNYIYSNIITQT